MSRTVGRFRISRTLGTGRFSKVLLGVDDTTGEHYALKVMRKDVLEELDMARYARREAFVLRRLDHPHITPLVEAVQSDRKLFLVMPVAPGVEMLGLVERGPLPEPLARRYIRQIVDATGYIHARGVAHRDLKPENVICDPERSELKIIDFGLTGFVEGDELMHTTCGTAEYSAPEVTWGQGDGYSGTAADAWSVGVLAYILLVGVHPFVGEDGELMEDELRSGVVEMPRELAAGAKDFLTRLIRHAPSERWSMAQAGLHPWLTSVEGERRFPGEMVWADFGDIPVVGPRPGGGGGGGREYYPPGGRSGADGGRRSNSASGVVGRAIVGVKSEGLLRGAGDVLAPEESMEGFYGRSRDRAPDHRHVRDDAGRDSVAVEQARGSSIFSRRESYMTRVGKQMGGLGLGEDGLEGPSTRAFARARQTAGPRSSRRRSVDAGSLPVSEGGRKVHVLPRVGFGRTRVSLAEAEADTNAAGMRGRVLGGRAGQTGGRSSQVGAWWARRKVAG